MTNLSLLEVSRQGFKCSFKEDLTLGQGFCKQHRGSVANLLKVSPLRHELSLSLYQVSIFLLSTRGTAELKIIPDIFQDADGQWASVKVAWEMLFSHTKTFWFSSSSSSRD